MMFLTLHLALSLAFSFNLHGLAAANNSADAIVNDFTKTKKTIEEQDLKQRQILSALYQVNKQIKKTVTEKSNLSQERFYVESSIQNLAQKVIDLETKTKSQKTLLAERLKAIYQFGGQSLARLFINTKSSAQLERNLKILGIVAERDLDLIKDYSQDKKDLESKKNKLAGRLEYLKKLQAKIQKKEKSYLAEQQTKNKILDGIRKNKMFAISKMNNLRQKTIENNIDDSGVFDLLFRPSFADQKGLLPTPVSGQVAKKFGIERTYERNVSLNHKGIFISSLQGQEVHSVFEGRISFVGDLQGYGKTIIVDHGDHFYSVYSHLNEAKINQGDEVKQSQVIASSGHSIKDNLDGLYFEIRHFSEPYDPQQWMKGLNL